jgi:glutamine cyclotransferase
MRRAGILWLIAAALAPLVATAQTGGGIPVQAAQVVRRLPHDREAYTEGLFIDRGQLFESTGQVSTIEPSPT